VAAEKFTETAGRIGGNVDCTIAIRRGVLIRTCGWTRHPTTSHLSLHMLLLGKSTQHAYIAQHSAAEYVDIG